VKTEKTGRGRSAGTMKGEGQPEEGVVVPEMPDNNSDSGINKARVGLIKQLTSKSC
jgi:hypothetical protein